MPASNGLRESLQPLYLLCDASSAMDGAAIMTANLLLVEIVSEIGAAPELSRAVRLAVQDFADETEVLLHLQDVDTLLQIPEVTARTGQPSFVKAFRAVRSAIDFDIQQVDRDDFDVRSPLVVLLAGGGPGGDPGDDEASVRAAVDALNTADTRPNPTSEWAPVVLPVMIGTADPAVLSTLSPDGVATVLQIAEESDRATVAAAVVSLVTLMVRSAYSGARVARWVVAERDVQLNLPEVPGDLVLRRYESVPDGDGDPFAALLDLTSLRDGMPTGADADFLLGHICWPARVVVADTDPTAVVGVVLPARPVRFVADAPGHDDAIAQARLCVRLTDAVAQIHTAGLRIGEEAFDSVLYAPGPELDVYFARGDTMRVVGRDDHASVDDDLLLLARVIGRFARAGQDVPGVLDDLGRSMLADSTSRVLGARPTAWEWQQYLARRVQVLQGPPVITYLQVSPSVVARNETVVVRWRARYVDILIVVGPDGTRRPVAPKSVNDGSVALVMRTEGQVRLEALNTVGGENVLSQWVTVFVPAELQEVGLPAAPDLRLAGTGAVDVLAQRLFSRNSRLLYSAITTAAVPMARRASRSDAVPDPFSVAPSTGAADEHLTTLLDRTRFPIDVAAWFRTTPSVPTEPGRRPWRRVRRALARLMNWRTKWG